MIQQIINKLFKRYHFWRHVGFDELSELYASEFLRSLAMSVVGIFVPVYLYRLGFSLQNIFLYQVVWAFTRPIWSILTAKSIARIGPKHTIALGTVVQIVYLAVLVTIDKTHLPIVTLGVLGSLSYALFGIALQVDFSKVKHTEHGGKELGFITICERIGSSLGPLVGGLVATYISPKATIFIAITIMTCSLIPIFMSAEPIKVHQSITIKGFPWRRHKRDFISICFFGIENVVSVVIWPIFVALAVFKKDTFAALGLLISISTLTALIAIYTIGKLIDDRRGGLLLKWGAIGNSLVHVLRPFVTTAPQAFTIGVVDEPLTVSYRMPYNKGMYDASDSVPGYRIVYLVALDIVRMLAVLFFWIFAYALTFFMTNDVLILKILFVLGSISSLGILTQRFPALRS